MLYQGDFSPKIMLPLIEMAEQAVQKEKEEPKQSIRAAHVVVEMIQNIQRHGIHTQENYSQGYFAIGRKSDSIQLISSNLVNKNAASLLSQRLNEINELDEAGKKDLLRNTLKSSLRQENPIGRGLGLSEIAGATSAPLTYSFAPASSDLVWFTLQVEI